MDNLYAVTPLLSISLKMFFVTLLIIYTPPS
nr:MAG TPA: hypothetical protein [Caudoviricetes sp.]DAW89859.1 MAG TPA: hypothetical protein [Caudoviricetes sp.]